jgi:hypothetical protein
MHPLPPVLAFFLSVSVLILISSDLIDFFFVLIPSAASSSLDTSTLHSCFKPGKASQSVTPLFAKAHISLLLSICSSLAITTYLQDLLFMTQIFD